MSDTVTLASIRGRVATLLRNYLTGISVVRQDDGKLWIELRATACGVGAVPLAAVPIWLDDAEDLRREFLKNNGFPIMSTATDGRTRKLFLDIDAARATIMAERFAKQAAGKQRELEKSLIAAAHTGNDKELLRIAHELRRLLG